MLVGHKSSLCFRKTRAVLNYFLGMFHPQHQLRCCVLSRERRAWGQLPFPDVKSLLQASWHMSVEPERMAKNVNAVSSHGTLVHAKLQPNCQQWEESSAVIFDPEFWNRQDRGERQTLCTSSARQQAVQCWLLVQEYRDKSHRYPGRGRAGKGCYIVWPEKHQELLNKRGHIPHSICCKAAPACHYPLYDFQHSPFTRVVFFFSLKALCLSRHK